MRSYWLTYTESLKVHNFVFGRLLEPAQSKTALIRQALLQMDLRRKRGY